jgi:hypothetical protein
MTDAAFRIRTRRLCETRAKPLFGNLRSRHILAPRGALKIRWATFGPESFSRKVQKSWPEIVTCRRLSLGKRREKNRMPSVSVEDFWTYLMGPPADFQKSKSPPARGGQELPLDGLVDGLLAMQPGVANKKGFTARTR